MSRTQRAYLAPARHWASSDGNPLRPPMGMRVRLKAGFAIEGYPPRLRGNDFEVIRMTGVTTPR